MLNYYVLQDATLGKEKKKLFIEKQYLLCDC